MRITVKTTGAEELERNFKLLAREMGVRTAASNMVQALVAALQPWVQEARRRARRSRVPRLRYKRKARPSSPQHMADSIEARPDRRRTFTRAGDLAVYGGPAASHFWASKIEFGTKNHRAWPFMRPAWAAKKDEVLARVAVVFRERFDRAVKRLRLRK